MHISHIIQLVLIAVAILLMIGGFHISHSADAQGDGGIAQAVVGFALVVIAALIVIIAVLWFLIGGILGF